MPRAQNLMGTGLPAIGALAINGSNVNTVAGIGTAQTGAASMGTADVILGTTTAGQTAFLLPDMNVGEEIKFINTSSTAALLFPVSSASINGGSANASFSVAQNRPVSIIRTSATAFWALYSA